MVRDIAKILKALADETRLQIMALVLKEGELCVCDFEEVLGISQSKSSRHLRYLLHAGILDDRREGVWVYYRVASKLSHEHRAVLKMLGELKRLKAWQAKKTKVKCDPKNKTCSECGC